jgi:D-3-phosphoglycerate dehydrogenase / 2-oxoglutarate reductase
VSFVIVVADDIDESGLRALRNSDGYEVISTSKHPERLPAELGRADALLVRSSTQVTEELLRSAPRLKVIGRAGIGVDNIDVPAASRRGIAVMNAPGANTVSAAEHTIALLFALVRQIPPAVDSMRRGEWDRKRFGGTELRGKTLGLVGLGRIGMHVAGIARALGMDVIAFDPYLAEEKAADLGVTLMSLEEVLKLADVVSLHAPLTDATRHLLNAERLALMKPGAVVVNAARGALIDDNALVDAVKSGRLAGAALDVFEPEPLPADSVLRSCEKIILTPHLAASTQEAQHRVADEICDSIRKALEHGDIGGAVNVPGVSSSVLTRARGAMELAIRLGRLAGAMTTGPVDSVEVYFGGKDDGSAKPVSLGAVQGLLESMGVGPVSLVNVNALAEERNIAHTRQIGRPAKGSQT